MVGTKKLRIKSSDVKLIVLGVGIMLILVGVLDLISFIANFIYSFTNPWAILEIFLDLIYSFLFIASGSIAVVLFFVKSNVDGSPSKLQKVLSLVFLLIIIGLIAFFAINTSGHLIAYIFAHYILSYLLERFDKIHEYIFILSMFKSDNLAHL